MKILMVLTRELCYKSGSFFLARMEEALRLYGHEVVVVDISGDNPDYDVLETLIGKGFGAVIDINSKLPLLEVDSGELYLNELGARFIQFIVDHPLFHHPSLMMPVKNGIAVGIDKRHVAYMKEHYRHYDRVLYSTMPGTKGLCDIDFNARRKGLLFTGTYESPQKQLDQIKSRPKELSDLMLAMIDLEKGRNVTHEEALAQLIDGYPEVDLSQFRGRCDKFTYLLNKCYLVDKYLRNLERENILYEFAKAGIPINIVGEGWEKSRICGMKNVTLHPPVNFSASFDIIGAAEMLLDISPLFAEGIHDRVTTAFANRTLCLTDMNPRADDRLKDEESLLYFDRNNPAMAAEKVRKYLDNHDLGRDMAENAHRIYRENYSWEKMGEFLDRVLRA